jgi:hypothetical protein
MPTAKNQKLPYLIGISIIFLLKRKNLKVKFSFLLCFKAARCESPSKAGALDSGDIGSEPLSSLIIFLEYSHKL